MKNYFNTITLVLMLSFFLSIVPEISFGQLGDPGDDPDAPIDGGVSLLVAAGVGYGLKKARDQRKKNKTASITDNI